MFTREDAIKVIAEKFPNTETKTSKDYINGGTRTWVSSPETRLDRMIDLAEPTLDGLKKDASGLDVGLVEFFKTSVEHDYKNENGLW